MTSKKRSNPFRATFFWGITFVLTTALLLILMIGVIVKNLIPGKNYSEQVRSSLKEEDEDSKSLSTKKVTDTIYVTKTVVEKCTKRHCEVEITQHPSPTEDTRQPDSTNN